MYSQNIKYIYKIKVNVPINYYYKYDLVIYLSGFNKKK